MCLDFYARMRILTIQEKALEDDGKDPIARNLGQSEDDYIKELVAHMAAMELTPEIFDSLSWIWSGDPSHCVVAMWSCTRCEKGTYTCGPTRVKEPTCVRVTRLTCWPTTYRSKVLKVNK